MRRRLRIVLALLGLVGCGDAPRPSASNEVPAVGPSAPTSSGASAVDAGAPPVVVAPEASHAEGPRAGEMVAIPAGVVLAGSRPGSVHREPRDEADLVPVELAGFSIDRLPYPNDPAQPPRTRVSHEEAAGLCVGEGKRLCSELEWERACEGEASERRFPGGEVFDAGCDATSCPSPEGVLGLGALGEWTASAGTRGLSSELAVFRGGASAEPGPRRCASRRGARPGTRSEGLGFRCCSGPVHTVTYPDEERVARHAPLALDRDEARARLRAIPALARYADDFELFDQAAMLSALGGDVAPLRGWELPETGAIRWSPRTGEVVHVFAGRSGQSALLVVLHPMPDGSFVHGASFVREGEPAPIVLAFTPPESELLWSAAWGRAAEGGAVVVGEDSRVSIVQR